MRAMRPRLFEGKDDVMASAELASYLGDVARTSRVWLQDASTRPAAPSADGVRTLRVEIRAESDLLGTLMFLQALERGDKLVRIDRLDISRTPRGDEKDVETLSIAATISGFRGRRFASTTASREADRRRRVAAVERRGAAMSMRDWTKTPAMRIALGALGASRAGDCAVDARSARFAPTRLPTDAADHASRASRR